MSALGIELYQILSTTQLSEALYMLVKPLERFGKHPQEVAMVTSLGLCSVPLIVRDSQHITLAQRARGGSITSGHLAKRIEAYIACITPLFMSLMNHATIISRALTARSYEPGKPITPSRCYRLWLSDYCVFALTIGIIVAVQLV